MPYTTGKLNFKQAGVDVGYITNVFVNVSLNVSVNMQNLDLHGHCAQCVAVAVEIVERER